MTMPSLVVLGAYEVSHEETLLSREVLGNGIQNIQQ